MITDSQDSEDTVSEYHIRIIRYYSYIMSHNNEFINDLMSFNDISMISQYNQLITYIFRNSDPE